MATTASPVQKTPEAAELPSQDAAVRSRVADKAKVRDAIRQNAAFTVPFFVMNTLATVVACYGLLENSTAVVIGAMIIAMLLGPISGIALALVDGDAELLRKALVAEVGGAAAVLAVSFCIGLIHRDIPITHEILARTKPNLLDLMIALAGGAAGAYATVSPRLSVGLVGVAIATALVPPLATCGICLARHEPVLAWGGFLLFFTNLVAIQFASSVVMWLSGFHDTTGSKVDDTNRRGRLIATNAVSLAVLALLTLVMATNFVESLDEQTFENTVRGKLTEELSAYPGVHLADVSFRQSRDAESVVAVVRSPYSFTPERVGALESGLPKMQGKRIQLEVMSVIVKETTREGYLHVKAVSSLTRGTSTTIDTDSTSLLETGQTTPESAVDSKLPRR